VPLDRGINHDQTVPSIDTLRRVEKTGKGRALGR
jgi:hypothetical protein